MPAAHDHDTVQRGKDCQKQAKEAYENGDFEQAYHHYVEAETLYREARDDRQYWVTDRLFFMQSSALRCLEAVLDERPALFDVYRSKAEGFLEEWPEAQISSHISAKRISEALTFREWRASCFKGAHDFNAAGLALDQGDVARARGILEEFIGRTETSEDAEADALCALARSKIAMLPVTAELQKYEQRRNVSVIAGGYLRAARASHLPRESRSRQRQRFAAYRAWFLSYALKSRAFSLLRKTRLPVSTLAKAQCYLARAVTYAQRATSLLDDFPHRHAVYLQYWHGIVAERAHLLTYMTGGDNADFDSARHAWQGALGAADRLCEHGRCEEPFFPNRFYSLRELRIEQYFLDAAKAFRERRWPHCILLLETWQKECPHECLWSWRGVNVYIRLLGTKIINAVLTGGREQLRTLCTDLMKVANSEPVGSAARFFADEVARLPEKTSNEPLLNLVLNSFAQYFPLDSYVDSYQQSEQFDPFASLPQKIYDSLRIHPPSTEAEVERLKPVIFGGIEAFLGYMCDYYMQVSGSSDPVPQPDIPNLLERSRRFPFGWAKADTYQNHLQSLRSASDNMAAARATETFSVAYGDIRGALLGLKRFVPVVVDIRSTALRIEHPKALEAFPDWALGLVERQVLFIFVKPEKLPSIKVGRYYLRPGWRRGNRLSYPVTDQRLLLPARYVPRWEFWELEAANASLLLTESVRFEHLRTAVELLKSCKGGPEKPRVGAVIVKGGNVIAHAYRGEDDSDRHAEEIAIGKATRDDLKGAIMITTLEPCTSHGRSTSVASCAVLLIQNQFSKVIVGIPDPDNRIRGNGDRLLRDNNITVAYFPSRLAKDICDLNAEYISNRTKDDYKDIKIPRLL